MDFQYKHNWLVHETSEQWEGSSISGLARQEPRAICTWLHEEGQREERGGQEEEKEREKQRR